MEENTAIKPNEQISDPTPTAAELGTVPNDVIERPPPDPSHTPTPIEVVRNISNPLMGLTTHFESDAAVGPHEAEAATPDEVTPTAEDVEVKMNSSDVGDEAEEDEEDSADSTLRRVKVYVLNAERNWDDRGTGHVVFDDKRPALTVKSEADEDDERKVLLDSEIRLATGYQKQQDTLIVWSESDTCDLALSFQEKNGCDNIWQKICTVQGKDSSVNNTSTESDTYNNDDEEGDSEMSNVSQHNMHGISAVGITLPPCELSRVADIADMITSNMHLASKREMMANAIEQHDYVTKLLMLAATLEESKNEADLRQMYTIVKNLFMLNKNALLEMLLSDDSIKQVVGVLEYDPSLPEGEKREHRDYLWQQARFKEVCPITNKQLQSKIHQAYRANYIQEVILPAPSILEENLLSALNSFIFFTRVDIVQAIVDDYDLLRGLFEKLSSADTPKIERADCTMFLKELCTFAQTLQAHGPSSNKEQFFKTLSNLGVLPALEQCLACEHYPTRAAAMEIMAMFVDHNALMAREYMLSQGKACTEAADEPKLLINLLVAQLWNDEDAELACGHQLITVLKYLADPENVISTIANRTEKAEFLTFFYKHSMHYLVMPLLGNTANGTVHRDDYAFANAQTALCDYLMFCCEHHSVHARQQLTSKKLLERVLVLLKSKHAFLKLTALRLFRRVVGLKDTGFNRHIIKEQLFGPIVECYHRNGHGYNLLNSALLELFDYIRQEGIRELILHIGELYMAEFKEVTYVTTMQLLKKRYEQLTEFDGDEKKDSAFGSITTGKTGRPGNLADELESEVWDNEADDWDKKEGEPSSVSTSSPTPEENDAYAANLPSMAAKHDDDDDDIFAPAPKVEIKKPIIPQRSVITLRSPQFSLPKQTAIDDEESGGDLTSSGIVEPPSTSAVLNAQPTPVIVEPPVTVAAEPTVTQPMRRLVEYDDESSDEDDDEVPPSPPAIPMKAVTVRRNDDNGSDYVSSTTSDPPAAKRARVSDQGDDERETQGGEGEQ